jgi:hypothetical protein
MGTGESGRKRVRQRSVTTRSAKRPRPSRPEGSDVPTFSFQLVDAYLFDAFVERRSAVPEDPPDPRFKTHYQSHEWPGVKGFIGRLTIEATYRFRDEAICIVRTATQAHFVDQGDVEPDAAKEFRERDCTVLIWPYARANVAEIVRMMNLSLPALPTVDVRRALTELPLDSPDVADE